MGTVYASRCPPARQADDARDRERPLRAVVNTQQDEQVRSTMDEQKQRATWSDERSIILRSTLRNMATMPSEPSATAMRERSTTSQRTAPQAIGELRAMLRLDGDTGRPAQQGERSADGQNRQDDRGASVRDSAELARLRDAAVRTGIEQAMAADDCIIVSYHELVAPSADLLFLHTGAARTTRSPVSRRGSTPTATGCMTASSPAGGTRRVRRPPRGGWTGSTRARRG